MENPQPPADLIGKATGSNKGPLPLSPYIPDKSAPLAAVVAGITISILGTVASGEFSGGPGVGQDYRTIQKIPAVKKLSG